MAALINTGSSGTITLTGLVLEPAGTPVTGASVTGTLKDSTGGIIWINKLFTDMGNGTYAYAFSASDVPPPSNQAYILMVNIASGANTLQLKSFVLVQDLDL
jgi:hypothetical protein